MNRAEGSLHGFTPPALLVGEGRSGTTLLSAILNRHPRLCVTPETHFFRLFFRYPGGEAAFARDWPASLEWMVERMDATPDWQPSASAWLASLPSGGRRRFPGAAALFLSLGEDIARRQGKRLWIEKTPPHVCYLPQIRRLFPQAPIIHLVRDGRDVADSLASMPWSRVSRTGHLLRWAQRVGSARHQLRDDPHAIALRYEDLVQAPEQEIRRLCDFLDIDFQSQMLQPDGSEAALIETGQAHKELVRQPISTARVERWRHAYPDEEQKLAARLIGRELAAWGYPVELPKPARPLLVAWPLAEEAQRSAYTDCVAALCRALPDTLVEPIAGLRTVAKKELAPGGILITGEPLPPGLHRHGWLAALGSVLRLQRHLARLGGRQLVYFHHGSLTRSRAWTWRLRLERQVAKGARAIVVAPGGDTPEAVAKLLDVAPEKILGCDKGLGTRLAGLLAERTNR
ncbi:sulfotransferase [Thiohalobacter sp. IOR34]|uniref:sulfotransferase family protein n=1 Tax=Thiohalobacter sp. IOR34 TaxID=3057176 RepID=UPI0025B051AB|nr:sulfotransferase [Thiohalobacter sp. IOR34]WJW74440.1 sulfotransferase [Thiohalobacter sp. IOR34]